MARQSTRRVFSRDTVISTNGLYDCSARTVCSHRITLLARSVYPTVQHDRCGPTGGHPNPKKGGVALFYWITINADARPTEGGAVEEIEP